MYRKEKGMSCVVSFYGCVKKRRCIKRILYLSYFTHTDTDTLQKERVKILKRNSKPGFLSFVVFFLLNKYRL